MKTCSKNSILNRRIKPMNSSPALAFFSILQYSDKWHAFYKIALPGSQNAEIRIAINVEINFIYRNMKLSCLFCVIWVIFVAILSVLRTD